MTAPERAARLKAVIFDWAGTLVDFGSRAPMGAFVEAFARFGVTIDVATARQPMGLPKRAHIAALLAMPAVAAAWRAAQGAAPDEAAIDRVYEVFVPMNAAVVAAHADPVPGVVEALAWARGRGMRIGSTTGYVRAIMDRLVPEAAARGVAVETLVCADDLPAGRPSPLMMWHSFAALGIWPAAAAVKLDDTEPGIGEALAAGSWAVGVAGSGNLVGLSETEYAALPADERRRRVEEAAATLRAAGAHLVVESAACLPQAVAVIEAAGADAPRPLDPPVIYRDAPA